MLRDDYGNCHTFSACIAGRHRSYQARQAKRFSSRGAQSADRTLDKTDMISLFFPRENGGGRMGRLGEE